MSRAERPGHLELLGVQAEAALDGRGREIDVDGITIASCEDGQMLWVGAEVPEAVATDLRATFDGAARSTDPPEPPAALEPCRRILERVDGPVRRDVGPSYLFAADTQFASGVAIVRSSSEGRNALRGANPGNWHPIEWDELLDGRLGPWAIAIDGGVVVSVCHTPRPLTARAAECGVWTHPRFRGRGYAAAVASAWAPLVRAPGRYLFYSTDAGNVSSQRVARRLDLELLGWTWRLRRVRDDRDHRIHPLSSLRNT